MNLWNIPIYFRALWKPYIWLGHCAREGNGKRIHRSITEKYSGRFFNYLIWWVRLRVRVLVVVRVCVRVTVGARLWLG